jgi:Putative DNA-binding domain
MLDLRSKADLERLVAEDVQESLTLDYKDAAALGKASQQRNELFKDVSAFANSAGGQIVYGIQESDQHPVRVQDADAVDTAVITREWIEQVIDSNVHPRVKDLRIQPMETAPGRAAYVLTIPQARTDAPHQAPDHKYYYRQNFQSVPMEDYQVRDAMRRATTPELFVCLEFQSGNTARIEYVERNELSRPIGIALLGNRSNQPAFHTVVQLGIDSDLHVQTMGRFQPLGQCVDDRGHQQTWFRRRLSAPPDLPLFREDDPQRLSLTFGYRSEYPQNEHVFYLTTVVQTPGYSSTERWVIYHRETTLTLCEPGHRLNR